MSHHYKDKPNQKKTNSPKKNKFEHFFRDGLFLRSDFFDVWFLPATSSVEKKIHVIVRKKVSKRATERNKWRRRIKEMIRKEKHNDLLLLFSVKTGSEKATSSKNLLQSWLKVFDQYKKIKKLS